MAFDDRQAGWRRPEVLLILMASAVPLSFATWNNLINNFAIERAAFTGAEIGILQSLREVPGFLALGVVAVLLLLREQSVALWSLLLLGIGTAATGYFPTVLGLYLTTIVMSLGFHYYETVQSSLALQWIDKRRAPETLGRIIAAGSFTAILSYLFILFLFSKFGIDFKHTYIVGGGLTCLIALVGWLAFPQFPQHVVQHKTIIIRGRYWLYYALTFISGARRQIFVVFAGFLLVEKFDYSVVEISLLFFLNSGLNMLLAPKIGRLIGRWGERRALIVEYTGLIVIFVAYSFVADGFLAGGLYVLDHLFFALAIAIKTYFQKIADPADIASTAAVGFTINHIAAVVIPAIFGIIWLTSPGIVFLTGAAMAATSLALSMLVPRHPLRDYETVLAARVRV
ncbi:MAG: MFS transporter [Gammaproteobacteria bacterium]|nr:MFS transporter [Gammaproteobacteria bacterium]